MGGTVRLVYRKTNLLVNNIVYKQTILAELRKSTLLQKYHDFTWFRFQDISVESEEEEEKDEHNSPL